MAKVLLTGGTGFVGQKILKQLLERGYGVRILVRNSESAIVRQIIGSSGIELHSGDVTKAESLKGSCRGLDAVIHLVGIISEFGNSTFQNVHARGTENIVNASGEQGVRRFIHMSALGTRPNAVSKYHQTKWAAEEYVRSSRLDFTIFRPSLIYGPRDHFVNLFAKIIRFSPIVPVLGRKDALFQPVPVEEVASAFVRSLAEPRAIGKTYDLCGNDRLTLSQIIDTIMRVTRRKRLKVHIPAWLAKLQAFTFECCFPTVLRQAPPLNRDQLVMLEEDNVGDAAPAEETFALNMPGFQEGIAYLGPKSQVPERP